MVQDFVHPQYCLLPFALNPLQVIRIAALLLPVVFVLLFLLSFF